MRAFIALLCSTLVLVACGSGDSTAPQPPDPIPEQLYQVEFSQSTNDCGADNLEGFAALVIPIGGGTSLLGLDTVPIASTIAGDRLTFARPFPLDGDTVVTFAGTWTFAADRHTFTGPSTFAVSFGGPVVCTFSLPTTGSRAPTPETPPDQLPGEPITGKRSGLDLSLGPNLAVWGTIGDLTYLNGHCNADVTGGVVRNAFLPTTIPYPAARNFRAGAERDITYFRTWVFWAETSENSGLQQLQVHLGALPDHGFIGRTRWYYQYSFHPRPLLFAAQDWIDYTLPGGTTFSQTGERSFNLPYRGYYMMVTEVYWGAREGYAAAMWRGVTQTCAI